VFPVRYGLNSYIQLLFRRNSVFKDLRVLQVVPSPIALHDDVIYQSEVLILARNDSQSALHSRPFLKTNFH
jgi:hypothetical protein